MLQAPVTSNRYAFSRVARGMMNGSSWAFPAPPALPTWGFRPSFPLFHRLLPAQRVNLTPAVDSIWVPAHPPSRARLWAVILVRNNRLCRFEVPNSPIRIERYVKGLEPRCLPLTDLDLNSGRTSESCPSDSVFSLAGYCGAIQQGLPDFSALFDILRHCTCWLERSAWQGSTATRKW